MNIWAIVPVKPFNRSKSRLASVLNAEEREELSRKMLVDTLRTLSQVNDIDGILVVSRDSSALTLARNEGAQTVAESGNPELNDALTRATQAVMLTWGARGVLIVSSDLPLMQPSDIKEMLDMARLPAPTVVLAGDRHSEGTNAMLMRPPGLIPYQYGPGSYQRHIDEAERIGVSPLIYDSDTMGLDVDVPEDLDLYNSLKSESKSHLNGNLRSKEKADV